jgi:hypothetical protein
MGKESVKAATLSASAKYLYVELASQYIIKLQPAGDKYNVLMCNGVISI